MLPADRIYHVVVPGIGGSVELQEDVSGEDLTIIIREPGKDFPLAAVTVNGHAFDLARAALLTEPRSLAEHGPELLRQTKGLDQ